MSSNEAMAMTCKQLQALILVNLAEIRIGTVAQWLDLEMKGIHTCASPFRLLHQSFQLNELYAPPGEEFLQPSATNTAAWAPMGSAATVPLD